MPDEEIDLGATMAFVSSPPASAAAESLPALTILYHPEIDRVGERALLGALTKGRAVEVSRTALDFLAPGSKRGAPLGDNHLSRAPLRLLPLEGGAIRLALEECRTAISYRGEILRDHHDFSAGEVTRGVVLEIAQRVVVLLHRAAASTPDEGQRLGLMGDSVGVQRVRRDVRGIAGLDTPVLLRGEVGTGKELVARSIHEASARRTGPFVAVNLGAIPPALAAGELFGDPTAGKSQRGHYHAARGGTLFLDEIGEASPEVQVLLLRALVNEGGQGAEAPRGAPAEVRILAAADAELDARMADGRFRAPLFHRLSSYEIAIPPLRERRSDLGPLLVHFFRAEFERLDEPNRLGTVTPSGSPWLPASLVARLADLEWKGNIRQLRNVVHQLVIGSRGADHVEIGPPVERLLQEAGPRSRLPASESEPPRSPSPRVGEDAPAPSSRVGPGGRRRPAAVSEAEIVEVMRACRWDRKAAAARLRISRPSLYLLLENNPRFRKAAELADEDLVRGHRECGGDLPRLVDRFEVSEGALRRRLRQLGLA